MQRSYDERIERITAHLRRKPHDHQAMHKLMTLVSQSQRARAFNDMMKLLYPADDVVETAMRRHVLLDQLRPDRAPSIFEVV